ncbi:MAG: HPr-rel-A system PqqD family peptide chaperone [Comamonadaceae bacterium]|nr:HPr-rel-A system PqqD family peptide chaperone [Comamonadaceae bacterium]
MGTITAEDAGPAALWHCPRPGDYGVQLWADGAVVYDEASGDLHALSPVAGQLLQLVLTAPPSCAESLAQALLDDEASAAETARVHALLQEFAALGFIVARAP